MQADSRNGGLRLKAQALQLGAHSDCLRGREGSCPFCTDIMDALIDRVTTHTRRPTATATGTGTR
jgi:hypothetical protein